MTVRRIDYDGLPLHRKDLDANPLVELRRWIDHADKAGVSLANGATLSTVDAGGQPSGRIVLIKHIDDNGLAFYTNYDSRKGIELRANPRASLCLWWRELHRQVRVDGTCQQLGDQDNDRYFGSRPRDANLSAIASKQSSAVSDRGQLDREMAQVEEQWRDRPLERPENWGGYTVRPEAIEFWQGRPDRRHDRLVYRRGENTQWTVERLYP